MNTQENLKAIARLKDPSGFALETLANSIQVMKGDKGDTPVKGKDYFTKEEISSIIDFISSNIQKPKNGIDGINGRTPIHIGKMEPISPQKGDLWYQD